MKSSLWFKLVTCIWNDSTTCFSERTETSLWWLQYSSGVKLILPYRLAGAPSFLYFWAQCCFCCCLPSGYRSNAVELWKASPYCVASCGEAPNISAPTHQVLQLLTPPWRFSLTKLSQAKVHTDLTINYFFKDWTVATTDTDSSAHNTQSCHTRFYE